MTHTPRLSPQLVTACGAYHRELITLVTQCVTVLARTETATLQHCYLLPGSLVSPSSLYIISSSRTLWWACSTMPQSTFITCKSHVCRTESTSQPCQTSMVAFQPCTCAEAICYIFPAAVQSCTATTGKPCTKMHLNTTRVSRLNRYGGKLSTAAQSGRLSDALPIGCRPCTTCARICMHLQVLAYSVSQ